MISIYGWMWLSMFDLDFYLKLHFDNISQNRSNVYYSVEPRKLLLDIDFNVNSLNELGKFTRSRFGMSKSNQFRLLWFYFQVLLHPLYKEKPILNQWTSDLEDLIIQFFILLRIMNDVDLDPNSAYSPSWMDCNDGRSSHSIISFFFMQYLQLLSMRDNGTPGHLM